MTKELIQYEEQVENLKEENLKLQKQQAELSHHYREQLRKAYPSAVAD